MTYEATSARPANGIAAEIIEKSPQSVYFVTFSEMNRCFLELLR